MILSGGQYVPERQCTGCGKRGPKDSMIRICIRKDGLAAVDPDGKMQSRGIYVCRNAECIDRAIRRKAFARLPGATARRQEPDELKRQLLEQIADE